MPKKKQKRKPSSEVKINHEQYRSGESDHLGARLNLA
jgi:hypothetical protein